MRRRTKKLGSRRTTIYIIVIILLVAANYIHGLSDNTEPTAIEQGVEVQEIELPTVEKAEPESPAKPSSKSQEPRSGWAELPTQKESKELYIAHHMCDEDTRNYTVCYSSRHRSPMWIAAPMHSHTTAM